MKAQDGFVMTLLIIVIALAAIGTGAYFYSTKSSDESSSVQAEKIVVNSATETHEKVKELIGSGALPDVCTKLEVRIMSDFSTDEAFSSCITDFAKTKKDISICDYKGYKYHDTCIGDIARLTGDPELCYRMNQGKPGFLLTGQHLCYDDVTGVYDSWKKVIEKKAITDQYANVKNYPYKITPEVDESYITEERKGMILKDNKKTVQDCIDSPTVQLDLHDPNAKDIPEIKAYINACAYYILKEKQLVK